MAETINIGTMVAKITGDISGLIKARKNADKELKGIVGGMQRHSKALLLAGGAMATGLAVSAKMAGDFQQSIVNAVSVTGLMGPAAKKAEAQLSALGEELGAKTKFSAKEAGDAMYDLASSGWKVADMAKGLPGIMNLAAATQADLTATTETVTSTLKQFGLQSSESGRVADVFTKAIGSSKATIDKLAVSMNYVGPVAHAVGLSLEDTTAILSKLYDAGYDGSMAGTALRGAISRLLQPTKKAATALQQMGIKADDVNPSLHNMKDILALLQKKGITAAQAMAIFGVRAGPAMLSLVNQGTKGIYDLDTSLKKSGGTAQKIAEEQLNTFNGQMTILKSSLQGVAIGIGQTLIPTLTDMTKGLIKLINKFNALPESTKRIISKLAVFTTGGLLAAGAIGSMHNMVQNFMPVLNDMFGFIKNTAIPGLMSFQAAIGPIGWAIEGIIAVIAILVLAWKNDWGGIREKTAAVWEKIKPIFEGIKKIFNIIIGLVKDYIGIYVEMWHIVQPIFHHLGRAFSWIGNVVSDVFGTIKGWFDDFVGWIQNSIGKIAELIDKIKEFFHIKNSKEQGKAQENAVNGEGGIFDVSGIGAVTNIPGHAAGGYFTQPHIAMVAEKEPEYVIPQSQAGAFASQFNNKQQMRIQEQILAELRRFNNETAPALSRDIALAVNGIGSNV